MVQPGLPVADGQSIEVLAAQARNDVQPSQGLVSRVRQRSPVRLDDLGEPFDHGWRRADDGLRDEAEKVLAALAGPQARLRPDQWRAIEALVVRRGRVLCVQRTGWGKSAVYFVATALLRARGAGPTRLGWVC